MLAKYVKYVNIPLQVAYIDHFNIKCVFISAQLENNKLSCI